MYSRPDFVRSCNSIAPVEVFFFLTNFKLNLFQWIGLFIYFRISRRPETLLKEEAVLYNKKQAWSVYICTIIVWSKLKFTKPQYYITYQYYSITLLHYYIITILHYYIITVLHYYSITSALHLILRDTKHQSYSVSTSVLRQKRLKHKWNTNKTKRKLVSAF